MTCIFHTQITRVDADRKTHGEIHLIDKIIQTTPKETAHLLFDILFNFSLASTSIYNGKDDIHQNHRNDKDGD